jgi:hypothetical protein
LPIIRNLTERTTVDALRRPLMARFGLAFK